MRSNVKPLCHRMTGVSKIVRQSTLFVRSNVKPLCHRMTGVSKMYAANLG